MLDGLFDSVQSLFGKDKGLIHGLSERVVGGLLPGPPTGGFLPPEHWENPGGPTGGFLPPEHWENPGGPTGGFLPPGELAVPTGFDPEAFNAAFGHFTD